VNGWQIAFQSISILISIGGAIVGIIAYRRSGSMKALDLRIELQKQLQIVRRLIDGLPMLIIEAHRSRANVLSTGRGGGSGALLAWKTQADIDVGAAKGLALELPPEDAEFSNCPVGDLEKKLLDIHSLSLRANAIAGRYRSSLDKDEATRAQIAADVRALHNMSR
jgi:hypothetical protein